MGFVFFNKLTKEDQLGRDIKLSNGNVASRILPIKIHDLDAEDQSLLENELGGVLRAVEFIHKIGGVNRPLNSKDDEVRTAGKILYRDQVNKVANAIKEIIISLKRPSLSFEPTGLKGSTTEGHIEIVNSIAVLPFTNMSSDPEQEYFSDGISEEIINMLAQVSGLKVAGRTSSFSFKGKNQDLRLIGEQLNVNHILEGSVRKSGNKLRITAQLIKVADGYHLYSEKFDRKLEDIFDIQDEISLAILNAIKIKLVEADKEDVLKRYTNNTEAYQLYLQGRYHVNKYNGTEAFTNGVRFYEAAIKIEPDYALAYAGIAYCYMELLMDSLLPPEQCLPPLYHAVKRTMELDDTIAESHLALAGLTFFYEWDFKSANIQFQNALQLNPNSASGNVHYAMYLMFTGNYIEACKQLPSPIILIPFRYKTIGRLHGHIFSPNRLKKQGNWEKL